MNHYPFSFGVLFASIMALVSPNPLWFLVLGIGIAANGIVIATNQWKMPVYGRTVSSIIHKTMTPETRIKWLADIIPTGFGRASIGDVFIVAGLMGAVATWSSLTYVKLLALLCIVWWGSGWSRGFRLFEKWPKEIFRHSLKNVPIMVVLILVGSLLRIRGCSVGELRASAGNIGAAMSPQKLKAASQQSPKWRDLGTLAAPPPQFIRRPIEDTEKQRAEANKELAIIAVTITAGGWHPTQKAVRSGPFCRVTCTAHHGGQYDVETIPELCRANWIPPNTFKVPGWYAVSDKEEVTIPWPGPAQKGFENYKLYWSELQSEAKVIHAAVAQ
jgi:hypothetical protein